MSDTQDRFMKALTKRDVYVFVLARPEHGNPIYACGSCACLFWPEDADNGWFPDRYAHANADNTYCGEVCPCHEVPQPTLQEEG